MILRWYAILAFLTYIHTYIQKSNTVVALAQAGIEARLRLGWQVGVGARLTDNTQKLNQKNLVFKIIQFLHVLLVYVFISYLNSIPQSSHLNQLAWPQPQLASLAST